MIPPLLDKKITFGKNVYDLVLPHITALQSNEINVFLIGARLSETDSLRWKIYDSLKKIKDVNLYFPEYIFEEQIFQKTNDLLSLENLLAESVHAIVLCVESAGSLTELGAFSNHKLLKNKLIVYLDKKYEKDKSFVNIGPARYLKQKTRSKVYWHPFEKFDRNNRTDLINSIREIKKTSKIKSNLTNPIFAERYLLSLLYVLGNATKKDIINIIKTFEDLGDNIQKSITIVDSSISMLLKRRMISNYPHYQLTQNGRGKLLRELEEKFVYNELDRLRLDMINLSLRKYWNNVGT